MNLNFFLPNQCFFCELPSYAESLCHRCYTQLPWQQHHCPQCAIPMEKTQLCGHCLTHPVYYDKIIAPFRYESDIRRAITALKFEQKLYYASLLGKLFCDFFTQSSHKKPALLLPVPLHRKRLKERGFNQSLEITKVLKKHLAIPLDRYCLYKKIHTSPQSEQHINARMQNVRGAFDLQRPITCETVALIDDVVTTGSTASEIARLLKKQGVKKVYVFAMARTSIHPN